MRRSFVDGLGALNGPSRSKRVSTLSDLCFMTFTVFGGYCRFDRKIIKKYHQFLLTVVLVSDYHFKIGKVRRIWGLNRFCGLSLAQGACLVLEIFWNKEKSHNSLMLNF